MKSIFVLVKFKKKFSHVLVMISCIVKFHISMHKIFDNMLTDGLKFRGEEKEGRDDVIRRGLQTLVHCESPYINTKRA